MAIEVKLRRDTANQHSTFTGAIGEVTVDITNDTLRVHDGVTTGGHRLATFGDISQYTANLLAVTTNIVPVSNTSLDLGTAEKSWRDLYLSGNTIYIGDQTITTTANTISIQRADGADGVRLNIDSIRIGNSSTGTVLKSTTTGEITSYVPTTGAETSTNFANVSIQTLILQNVLGTEYGGTGLSSFTPNGILYAANSSSLSQATGLTGQILQIASDGTPTFDKLDGGDF